MQVMRLGRICFLLLWMVSTAFAVNAPTNGNITANDTPTFPSPVVTIPDFATLSLPDLVAGQYENGSVAWSMPTCRVGTSAIASAQLYANGSAVGTADTSTPYSGTWTTGYAVDTSVSLTARCTGSNGQTVDSPAQLVLIDVVAPVLSNLSAVATSTTLIEMSWAQVENGSGVTQANIGWCSPSPCTPTSQQTSTDQVQNITGLTSSTVYDFAVWATDNVGNASAVSAVVTASLSDLVAYLEFEDNVSDLSPVANTWTVAGNPTYVTGKFSKALNFDGTGDVVTAPLVSAYDIINILSAGVWVNCNTTCAVQDQFLAADDGTTNRRWGIRLDNVSAGLVEAYIIGGNTIRVAESTTNWTTTNAWHFLFMTYDGATIRLYTDGVLVASATYAGTIDLDSIGLAVGARNNAAQAFTGLIDRVTVHNRVLSLDNIKYLYAKGLTQLAGHYNQSVEQYAESYAGQGYAWANNALGMQAGVPAPFTPVTRTGQDLGVWNRTYDYNNSLLPVQIVSGGTNLFHTAPTFTVTSGSTTAGAGSATYTMTSETPERVAFRTLVDSTDFQIIADSSLEVDGFLRVDARIVPKVPHVRIDDVKLTLPIVKALADRYSRDLPYDYDTQSASTANILSAAGYIEATPITFPFNPVVWVGDNSTGLEVLNQTNVDINVANVDTVYTITPGASSNDLVINLVDGPFVISDELTFSFALLPTPTKPMPVNWRTWYIHATGGTVAGSVILANSLTSNWRFIFPATFNVSGLNLEYPGLPIHETGTTSAYQASIASLHAADIDYAPYSALYSMANNVPELTDWRTSWESANERNGPWSAHTGGNPAVQPIAYWHRSLQDFMLETFRDRIATYDIDGVYMDFGNMTEISGLVPKFFPTADEETKTFYSIYGSREYLKRFWKMSKALKSNFWITHHTNRVSHWSGAWNDASATGELYNKIFQDLDASVVDGQWVETDDYTPDYLTLPYLLFPEEYQENWGFVNVLLPQVRKNFSTYLDANPTIDEGWSRTMLGLALVSDMQLFRTQYYPPLRADMATALDRFGALTDDVTRVGKASTGTGNDVEVAGYKRAGKLWLVWMNKDTSNADSFTYNITTHPDLSGITLTSAKNSETNTNITFTGTTVNVSMPAKGFMTAVFDTTP